MAQPKKVKHLDKAKIIAVYNQKGGCGKTQVSMQLGGTLALRGYRVIIVDMDPQGTSLMWSGQAGEQAPFPATVISLSKLGNKLVGEVSKFFDAYDFIIIDCPPAIDSTIPWSALLIADLGLMPIIPLVENIWASQEAISLGQKAQQENPGLQLRFVPSNVGRGNLYQAGLEAIREQNDVEVFAKGLSSRIAFPTSAAMGCTAHGLASSSPAIDEVEAVTSNVLKVFGIKG